MSRYLPIIIPFLVLAAASAEEDGLREAKRSLEAAFTPGANAKDRVEAVHQVGSHDVKEAAKLLVGAIGRTQALLEPRLARQAVVGEELERIEGGKILEGERTYPKAINEERKKLRREAERLRGEIDGENRVLQAIGDGLAGMRNEDVVDWLGRSALRREKHWKARQIVAGALAEIGTAVAGEHLAKGLRDKDDRVRLTAAIGVGRLKVAAALDSLLDLLRDKAWTVRSAAIQALGDIGEKGAVGPLITQIGKEEGRLREDCAQALSKLTGQKFGQLPDAWRRWWEKHKDEYGGEGGKPLGGHPPDKTGDPGPGYYGIPITTSRAIFVVDISGSMAKSTKDAGADPGPGELSKIETAKRELTRVLEGFDPKGAMNVIIFNDVVKRWKDGMVPATRPNKDDAKAFVADLEANSSTNIYDALDSAFRIAGMGARDKHYEPGADTIFLLSDGSPTKPDGTPDDWMKIIRACREWNRLKRIKIHAIGVGGHNVVFMRMLAEESGGNYVSR